MKKRVVIGLYLGILLFIGLGSAEVLVGQTESLYSLGDSLNVNVTLSSSVGTSDFLVSKLVCGSGDIEIYRSPYNLKSGERKVVQISFKLDSLLLRNLGGVCNIAASYGGSSSTSQSFDVNDEVNVQFYSPSVTDPGNEVKISGSVKKSNGDLLDGFFEISVEGLGLSNKGLVKDGQFNGSVYIPKNAVSGTYEISVKVYDRDDLNAIANEGANTGVLRVKQIIEGIDIAFEKMEITPGEDFAYSILLLDQAGKESKQEVEVSLINPNGEIVKTLMVFSGVTGNFSFKTSDISGNWKVSSKFNQLTNEKTFYVAELEDADFYIANNTLYAINVGNMPYWNTITLAIGEETVFKEISLGVGETKKFKLSAPAGSYNIKIVENDGEQYLGRALLSGNSIGVGEYDEISKHLSFWIWLVALIALCLAAIYFYKKSAQKRYYGKGPETPVFKSSKSLRGFGSRAYESSPLKPVVMPVRERDSTISELKRSSLKALKPAKSDFGKKEKSVVVALNVRNLEEMAGAGEDALAPIGRIIDNAKKAGAKFKDENNYKLFIFAQSINKKKNNTYDSLQFIKKVDEFLTEHNKKKALKINYGIGGNSGDLIIEAKQGQFMVNSSGNTILLAKKAAARAKNEAIISQALKHDLPGIVKATAMPGENFFKLNSLVDRSPQEEFISKFMNRQQRK